MLRRYALPSQSGVSEGRLGLAAVAGAFVGRMRFMFRRAVLVLWRVRCVGVIVLVAAVRVIAVVGMRRGGLRSVWAIRIGMCLVRVCIAGMIVS